MSNLTFLEKRKFEQLLGMSSGYVLEFSNRSFAEFVLDSTGRDIYDSRYDYASGSKANRLRAFWQKEENAVVGKLMSDMLDLGGKTGPLQEECRGIVARLLQCNTPVPAATFNQTNNAVVRLQAYGGAAAVTISGPGGDLTPYTVVKGSAQELRPSATIVGVELGREHFVGWDGIQYQLRPTLASLLADNLEPVGKVSKAQSQLVQRSLLLAQLKEEFLQLADERDRSRAGLALEKLLNRLFEIFELRPRQPFRVVGEQIDGSFELDGQIYLLESKWEKHALPEADLLIFRGKIEGKSTFTRGVFIALNDISLPARDAITRGKAPSFFVMNGYDLMMILNEAISLTDFLRKRVRLLAEEGRVCVPFAELA